MSKKLIRNIYNTEDVKNLLIEKYKAQDFRINKDGVKTIELQGIQFVADKDYIIREPNYEYAQREIKWYESQSLNVYDMEGDVPLIWKKVADVNGDINSNYGWMIFSKENGSQYKNCLWNLVNDTTTRQAVMIYNRPEMQQDWNKNHKHDFCCTFAVQYFLNKIEENKYELNTFVLMRSNDAVFGYDNDVIWQNYVRNKPANEISERLNCDIIINDIIWYASSLHVYERHFKFLEK